MSDVRGDKKMNKERGEKERERETVSAPFLDLSDLFSSSPPPPDFSAAASALQLVCRHQL